MPEELKDLIEKIQEEGLKVAEDKAKQVEEEAKNRAASIIAKAEKKKDALISEAEAKITRMEQSSKTSLKQAGRDLMLTLRKEINAMLDKIIASHIQEALSPAELAKIIAQLIEESKATEKKDIEILLKKQDLEKLKNKLFNELKAETKKDITLKASEDMRGGFIISYDKGKSHYDFTDTALAEYITIYLKPKLAEMLKG